MGTQSNKALTAAGTIFSVLFIILVAYMLTGCQGDKGMPGIPGRSCSAMAIPGEHKVFMFCEGQKEGFYISDGKDGKDGADGTNGQDGQDGTDATPVAMIQLCPTVVGGYGNFPEYAFQVGNKLYGVLSGNTSAITRLYPGNYTTTTPNGTNCSFIVAADGITITH